MTVFDYISVRRLAFVNRKSMRVYVNRNAGIISREWHEKLVYKQRLILDFGSELHLNNITEVHQKYILSQIYTNIATPERRAEDDRRNIEVL